MKKYNLVFYFLFLIFILSGLMANEVYLPHSTHRGANSVEIPSGAGSREIARILKNEGVIRSSSAFMLYIIATNQSSNLRAGYYVFGRAAIPEIVRALVAGGTNEVVLVIPEGWTGRQIAERLNEKGVSSSEEFLKTVAERELEGYLFPDTYRVFKDASAEDVIKILNENFNRKLSDDLREEIKHQNKTIDEIVTMASLIEKEVVTDEDRALVSGIFWKRLKIGMGLQVDATITYIKNKELGIRNKGNGKVSIEDTKIDSPHNTYKYPGLPPGPISNPGLSAIKAAIYPKESPYLYYLSAPGGQTIFSQTLEEHNEAKAKYLK